MAVPQATQNLCDSQPVNLAPHPWQKLLMSSPSEALKAELFSFTESLGSLVAMPRVPRGGPCAPPMSESIVSVLEALVEKISRLLETSLCPSSRQLAEVDCLQPYLPLSLFLRNRAESIFERLQAYLFALCWLSRHLMEEIVDHPQQLGIFYHVPSYQNVVANLTSRHTMDFKQKTQAHPLASKSTVALVSSAERFPAR
eukprot:CAMPEP_0197638072 /NCGR_PEP_ID=MMETSP1338-20131121/13098_1 /TAXON_ID=43686 ORGANISM="Pelagodinium beii, Strain RCC1491" /NCGR_SAMPLE_ID=MMETSP1338 /ASSEMBLY_ACC=CAM_ASM_000754 /LENGTH=198 /DNA_ID=CAMNT_0043210587 /DNA_START=182 /DNA_END=780 /DNA_ORIENTATION=-